MIRLQTIPETNPISAEIAGAYLSFRALHMNETRQALELAALSLADASSSRNMLISTKTLIGCLAHSAVVCSPYAAPDNLTQALTDFERLYNVAYASESDILVARTWWSSGQLEEAVTRVMGKIPAMLAWNESKIPSDATIQFTDRYSHIDPDRSFIDLGAFVRNAVLYAWKDAVEFCEFNEKFAREYPTNPEDSDELAVEPTPPTPNVTLSRLFDPLTKDLITVTAADIKSTPDDQVPVEVKGLGYVSAALDTNDQQKVVDLLTEMGITGTIKPEKLHITLMYDESNSVLTTAFADRKFSAKVTGTERLGEAGSKWESIAVTFDCVEAQAFHREMKTLYGMEHSYPELKLHMSLKYQPTEDEIKFVEDNADAFKELGTLFFHERPWESTKY